MGSDLYFEDAKRIFKSNISYLKKEILNPVVQEKINFTKEKIKFFQILGLVKFVGISGSIAAKTAKTENDIDIFIVVKNGSSWIYRGLLMLKNIKIKLLRSAGEAELPNMFCPNLIVEERGLLFDEDIFTFHELFYLVPIFNEAYYLNILSKNDWVKKYGAVVINNNYVFDKHHYFLSVINYFAFLSQILFMKYKKHNPDVKRLFKNYLSGKIEFYPNSFKEEKLSNL